MTPETREFLETNCLHEECPVVKYYKDSQKKDNHEKINDMHTSDGTTTKCVRKL